MVPITNDFSFAANYNNNGSLKQLKILNIGFNSFSESLVPLLTSLTSLTSLFLEGNNLGVGFKPMKGMF